VIKLGDLVGRHPFAAAAELFHEQIGALPLGSQLGRDAYFLCLLLEVDCCARLKAVPVDGQVVIKSLQLPALLQLISNICETGLHPGLKVLDVLRHSVIVVKQYQSKHDVQQQCHLLSHLNEVGSIPSDLMGGGPVGQGEQW